MFTKKAMKLMKKLPKRAQLAAKASDESPEMGTMLHCSKKTLVSIRLPNGYRMVKTRDTQEVLWVGTHNDYENHIKRGGRF